MNDRDILRHDRLDQPGFAASYHYPAKLHAWLAASLVERRPRRIKGTGNPTVAITGPTALG